MGVRTAVPRNRVDEAPKLTREHAQERFARIGEVSYELEFDLDGEGAGVHRPCDDFF